MPADTTSCAVLIMLVTAVIHFCMALCEALNRLNSLPGEYAQITESCRSDTRSRVSNWITLQSGFVLIMLVTAVIHFCMALCEALNSSEVMGGYPATE
jgi:hypothetical protein